MDSSTPGEAPEIIYDEPSAPRQKHRHHQKTHRYSAIVEMLDQAKTVAILPASPLNSEIEIGEAVEDDQPANRPKSHNSADWNREPSKVRSETTVKAKPCEASRKNRLIISSNIRRKKMIIWMMILTLLLTWNGFADQLQRITEENNDTFSIDIIKPWLFPILITEFAMTALGLLLMMLKMKFMHDKCLSRVFRIITGINNIQYLMAMLALPFGIYFFFTELSTDMKKSLVDSKTENILPNWNATQYERQCCGFHSRNDWQPLPSINMVEYVHDPDDDDDDDLEEDVLYPSTCCNMTAVTPDRCTEFSKTYWDDGCHDKEFYVILDYVICFVALMLLTFILNVTARIWIDKTERYLTIFRPYEIF